MLNRLRKINFKKFAVILLISRLFAQDFYNNYGIQLNSNPSNQWWAKYNNFGQDSSKIKFDYSGKYKKNEIDYNVSISLLEDKFYLGESYIKSTLFKNTHIKIGKYYRDFSVYMNDDISSGSILISNNAQPMPKVGLLGSYELKKNESINFTFGIAHAFFKKNNIYNHAPMLHEKFLYLNYFKGNNNFGIGFVHEAMWAGGTKKSGKFPQSFKDFLKVFISADGPQLDGEPHANALGNHLGIWDFYYKNIVREKIFKIYYQHFFEDTSGLRFSNKVDGLWGLELENYIPNTQLLVEYLQTTEQDRARYNDAYYNHYQYTLGWSYNGYTLGNPFIEHLEVRPVKVLHLGLSGEIYKDYFYQFKVAREVNINDKTKYELIFTKSFNDNQKASISGLSVYILNNENMKNSIGMRLTFKL